MFAVLTNPRNIRVGHICNPLITYDVLNTEMEVSGKHIFSDKKNILNSFTTISKILLYGIADDMLFITPKEYPINLFFHMRNIILYYILYYAYEKTNFIIE